MRRPDPGGSGRRGGPGPASAAEGTALPHPRAGAILLEAIVALVILSVAGTAAVTLVGQSADAVRRARAADAEMREASAFFHAVALWPREDLDRRLGERPQGRWKLIVQRPTPTLYEVVLADSAVSHEVLRTTLFRPEPRRPELAPPGWPEEAPAQSGGLP
ncbi:MAG: hypothetical protein KY467_12695 [Gemmatimonadetes bacterium]|nr:hypothetical protein [Gemmatimonadota bacterium]